MATRVFNRYLEGISATIKVIYPASDGTTKNVIVSSGQSVTISLRPNPTMQSRYIQLEFSGDSYYSF